MQMSDLARDYTKDSFIVFKRVGGSAAESISP